MAKAKRKKKFFDVEMPLIKKQTQVQAYELKDLDNRLIKYDLTRILKGKNVVLQLKIKTEDNKATSIPRELKLLPSYLKRMMRKGTNYVEDSFSTDCKDAQIRIKPFMITRRKVSRAVKRALREKTKKELIKSVKTKDLNQLFKEILKNQLQKDLSLKLKKIYPLSLFEIRVLKVEKFAENKKTSEPKNKKDN